MNFRTTFFLIIAVAVVGGAAVWFSRAGKDAEPVFVDSRKLLNMTSADVTHVEFTAADQSKVALDRRSTGWRMAQPVIAAADSATVEGLLSSLTTMTSQGQVKLDGNEATLGLSPPMNVVTIATKDKTVQLSIGERSGTGGSMYVRVDDRPHADLVPAAVLSDLEKPGKAFRNMSVLSLAPADVSHITITDARDNSTIELRRAATAVGDETSPAWRMVQPIEANADPAATSDIVFAMARLRATDFVDETGDLARFELSQPQLTVRLETTSPAATQSATTSTSAGGVTVAFGKHEDALRENIYASVITGESATPMVVTVPAAVLETVRKKPTDLRDRALLSIAPETVRKITIAHETSASTQPAAQTFPATIVLERVEPPATRPATQEASTRPTQPSRRWRFAGGDSVVDDEAVDELLATFQPLRVDRYLSTLNFVTVPQTVIVTLETADGQTHAIRLFPTDSAPPPSQPEGTVPPISGPVNGSYNDVYFELPAFVLQRVQRPFDRG